MTMSRSSSRTGLAYRLAISRVYVAKDGTESKTTGRPADGSGQHAKHPTNSRPSQGPWLNSTSRKNGATASSSPKSRSGTSRGAALLSARKPSQDGQRPRGVLPCRPVLGSVAPRKSTCGSPGRSDLLHIRGPAPLPLSATAQRRKPCAQSSIWRMSQASACSRILAPSCWNVWSGQPSGGQAIVARLEV